MKTKVIIKHSVLSLLIVTAFISCTDLEIEGTDSIITKDSDAGFTPLANPSSTLEGLYNSLGADFGTQENIFALSEVSSDALVVPTRGTDWGDNGIWRQLHTHTWRPDHQFVLNTWNNLNQRIFTATSIIASNTPSNPIDSQVLAEAKFIRALNMFFVMDFFGVVPFREVTEGPDVNPKVLTRIEAYNLVEKDLLEALVDLPTGSVGTANTGTATKAAANFLLAKLYLNSFVYDGSGTPDNAIMQKVIDNVDDIAASGFGIADNGYFQIFEPSDDNETILFVKGGIGFRIWNSLHYNQPSPDQAGGWNGFSTLSEFYDSFEGAPETNYVGDGQEERRGWVPDATNADKTTNSGIGYGFLIGQQYDSVGIPLKNRQGQPLSFTKDIPALVGNTEQAGMRLLKYHPYDPTETGPKADDFDAFRQHMVLFRYADAHLMKAEAMLRMGNDVTALVNELRSKREDTPDLSAVDMNELLAERGRELYMEFWRRNDLIRFGKFTAQWQLKEVFGNTNVNLFPIPQTALLSNPNLVQNPGY